METEKQQLQQSNSPSSKKKEESSEPLRPMIELKIPDLHRVDSIESQPKSPNKSPSK